MKRKTQFGLRKLSFFLYYSFNLNRMLISTNQYITETNVPVLWKQLQIVCVQILLAILKSCLQVIAHNSNVNMG